MKRIFIICSISLGLWAVTLVPAAAVSALYDYAFNINGDLYFPGDALPNFLDTSSFDFNTGLGSITLEYAPEAAGKYSIGAFFDHEIDQRVNTYFNEYGTVTGTPAKELSWEIDEPGYVFGDIYDNFLAGSLDNINAVPFGADDDVSLAFFWDFDLLHNEHARIRFHLSETEPLTNFFLSHYDPHTEYELHASTTLEVIPEPTTLMLLGLGIFGLAAWSRRNQL